MKSRKNEMTSDQVITFESPKSQVQGMSATWPLYSWRLSMDKKRRIGRCRKVHVCVLQQHLPLAIGLVVVCAPTSSSALD
jgi:hypothetical protein